MKNVLILIVIMLNKRLSRVVFVVLISGQSVRAALCYEVTIFSVFINTLLFHSLEFDIDFNIANSSQYLGTASTSVTFGVPLEYVFYILSLFQRLKQIDEQCSFILFQKNDKNT